MVFSTTKLMLVYANDTHFTMDIIDTFMYVSIISMISLWMHVANTLTTAFDFLESGSPLLPRSTGPTRENINIQ